MSAISHSEWAELLASFFFDEAHDGEEILFSVDSLSLAEASGLPEAQACDSLIAAVKSVITPAWHLSALVRAVERWRREDMDTAHPALPLLALSVLAASRMGEDQEVAVHNYYVPLRHLFDPQDYGWGPPGSFTQHVEWLWRDLARWANRDLNGRRGRLVIRDPGHFRYIGLAMQHALLKSGDLRHLDNFFRKIGLQPGEPIAPAELRRALSAWTAGRAEPWARRLWKVSNEPEFTDHCEALLQRESRKWDGRPRDPRTGRAIGRIRVAIESTRRPAPFLGIQWDDRLPEMTKLRLPHGMVALERWETWYRPLPLPLVDVEKALYEGLEVEGDDCTFLLQPDEVHALAYDDGLGAWASVDRMAYGDRYQLLVWNDSTEEVVRYLRRHALQHFDPTQGGQGLPKGWDLIRDVQIDARPTEAPPPSLAHLIPAGRSPRLRLLGGLPLGTAYGVYLRGGEPQVALSSVADVRHVLLRQLDTGKEERLSAGEGWEVELWRLHLAPGSYEVIHGESKASFQILDGIVEAAGQGAGTIKHSGSSGAEVSGTEVQNAPAAPHPVTVQVAREGTTWLIGPGRGDHCPVELPRWVEQAMQIPPWRFIDAWALFDVAWILIPDGADGYRARLANAIEPEEAPPDPTWKRLVRAAVADPEEDCEFASLWSRYVAKAGQA